MQVAAIKSWNNSRNSKMWNCVNKPTLDMWEFNMRDTVNLFFIVLKGF